MIQNESINKYLKLEIEELTFLTQSLLLIEDSHNFYTYIYDVCDNECLFDLKGKSFRVKIHFDKSYFEKYFHNFNPTLNSQTICCNVQSKLLELINCNSISIERSFQVESIVLSLLYFSIKSSGEKSSFCEACVFLNNPEETLKIKSAKEYILNNLGESLTIPKLAAIVGTNQCYLKKGFKELYSKTIFEFVNENRMVKADHLLRNSDKKLFEIAQIVGYSSLSSFSLAYKNYFGITPSLIMQL
jgi:AraC-like DNA-binding protein